MGPHKFQGRKDPVDTLSRVAKGANLGKDMLTRLWAQQDDHGLH